MIKTNTTSTLIADSLDGLESIQLSCEIPDPSNPTVKNFVVKNLRRREEKVFDTAADAFVEYMTDWIGELHAHLVNHENFAPEFARESLGYGNKLMSGFNAVIHRFFDDHEAGVFENIQPDKETVASNTPTAQNESNSARILLADSIPYSEPVQLWVVKKNPNDPDSRVFVVYNTRRNEELEFKNFDDAVAELVLDSICEFESVLRCGLKEGEFEEMLAYESIGNRATIMLTKFSNFVSILHDANELGILEHLKNDGADQAKIILTELAELLVRHLVSHEAVLMVIICPLGLLHAKDSLDCLTFDP